MKKKITRTFTTDEVVREYEKYAESKRRLRKIRGRKVKCK